MSTLLITRYWHVDWASWRYYDLRRSAPAYLKPVPFSTYRRYSFYFPYIFPIQIDLIAYKTVWLNDEYSWSYLCCSRPFWHSSYIFKTILIQNTIYFALEHLMAMSTDRFNAVTSFAFVFTLCLLQVLLHILCVRSCCKYVRVCVLGAYVYVCMCVCVCVCVCLVIVASHE